MAIMHNDSYCLVSSEFKLNYCGLILIGLPNLYNMEFFLRILGVDAALDKVKRTTYVLLAKIVGVMQNVKPQF